MDDSDETDTETAVGHSEVVQAQVEVEPRLPEVVEDNVVICGDTQVIRIDSGTDGNKSEVLYSEPRKNPNKSANNLLKKQRPLSKTSASTAASKIYSKRMTKRLLNEAEAFDEILSANPSEMGAAKITAFTPENLPPSALPPKVPIPKRKDLCKLLGLNEADVDLLIVPEVRVAQKVALSHSTDLSLEPTKSTEKSPSKNAPSLPVKASSARESSSSDKNKCTAKKKDLAKFLGVEVIEPISAGVSSVQPEQCQAQDSTLNGSVHSGGSSGGKERKSRSSERPKSMLVNWGQMVKSSVRGWRDNDGNGSCDLEMDVPVQLRQIPAKEPERTHRKDLSKFLGFDDDSDSEEILFFRTERTSAAETSMLHDGGSTSINDSSLTKTSSSCFDYDHQNDSDDSVGSLRSFDSFVRRSLRCGASSEFASMASKAVADAGNNNIVKTPPKRGATAVQRQQLPPTSQLFVYKHKGGHVTGNSNGNHMVANGGKLRKRKKDAAKRTLEVSVNTPQPPNSPPSEDEPDYFTTEDEDDGLDFTDLQELEGESVITIKASQNNNNMTLDPRKPPSSYHHHSSRIRPALRSNVGAQFRATEQHAGQRKGHRAVAFGRPAAMAGKSKKEGKGDIKMPPIFRREEPLFYPGKPPPPGALFYQHYPAFYAAAPMPVFGVIPPAPDARMAVTQNGRIRVLRSHKRPQMKDKLEC